MHELRAFVNIFVEASLLDEVVEALSKIDAVEELYEVTGEFDIVTLVWASNIEELSDVLKNKIMKIKGVKSTITCIALSPQKSPKCAT
jgi:DNA-binding Lrp family transcriptional regulator